MLEQYNLINQLKMIPMEDIWTYIYIFGGILISFLLPVLQKEIPTQKNTMTLRERAALRWKEVVIPYFAIMLFSALTALLLLAFFEQPITDWRAALLAGYAWDSTIQKIKGK